MVSESLLTRSIKYQQEYGSREFLKEILRTIYRSQYVERIQSVLTQNYNELVIDSTELRAISSEEDFWELKHDQNLLTERLFNLMPLCGKSVEMFCSPFFEFKQPFVTHLDDITILGDRGLPVTDAGRIVADTLSFDPYNQLDLNSRVEKAIRAATYRNPYNTLAIFSDHLAVDSDESLRIACPLLGGALNYYHWTLENLMKLRGVSHYEKKTGESIQLIVQADPPDYVEESLEILEVNERVYYYDGSYPLQIDRMVVPSYPELTPENLQWLRKQILGSVPETESDDNDEVFYISRQHANTRRIKNYDSIKPILQKFGIKSICCQNLSLKEEVQLFRSADCIIGPHGAGLSAMVWGTDMEILEIFNGVVQPPYNILAHILGHGYSAIACTPVDGSSDRNADMVADIKEFEQMVQKLVDR